MPDWLNHVAIATPRNATTTHTVSPASGTVAAGALFTPTSGRFLLCVVEGSVTSTTPPGWSMPAGAFAVNNTGLYAWHLPAAAGNDSFTTTHNGSNYPVVFDFYEFPAGSAFSGAASATGVSFSGAAGPTLSGLSGPNWIAGAVGQDLTVANGLGATFTWNAGVETADTAAVGASGTDGYGYSLTALDSSMATSQSFAATSTSGNNSLERLVIAVAVATPPATPAEESFNSHAMARMRR